MNFVFFRKEHKELIGDDDYGDYEEYEYPNKCNSCEEYDACKKSVYDFEEDENCCACKHSDFEKLPHISHKTFQNHTNLKNFTDFKLCCPDHGYLHHDNECNVQNFIIQSDFFALF